MISCFRFTAVFALLGLFLAPAARAQHPSMLPGMSHEEHMAQIAHHFRLTPDGGSIAVEANDPADETSRDQIRVHLKEIAVAFGQGDFQKPFMTHSEVPPGVAVMQRLKTKIAYAFEETARGGVVRISTSDPQARTALHEFLTYQIKEHATGRAESVRRRHRTIDG